MTRHILFRERESGMSIRFTLLEEEAPLSSEFLWQLAAEKSRFEAIHGMWTGPELSCPLPASTLPENLARKSIPEENATSFPEAGEVVLASMPAQSVKGLPPGNFFDIGLFYGSGGRLLMPFGWIRANVCAKVVPGDLDALRTGMETIRRNGACKLLIEPAE